VQKGENAHRLQMALPKPADAPVTSAVSCVMRGVFNCAANVAVVDSLYPRSHSRSWRTQQSSQAALDSWAPSWSSNCSSEAGR
jgi:hypothetical protein